MEPHLYVEMLTGEPQQSFDEYKRLIDEQCTDGEEWFTLDNSVSIVLAELDFKDEPEFQARLESINESCAAMLRIHPYSP